MAGHSKWANIQHRKGRQDAKRGKIFTRLIKEIAAPLRCLNVRPLAVTRHVSSQTQKSLLLMLHRPFSQKNPRRNA